MISMSADAQSLKRLHVGDKVPNVLLKKMVNYKNDYADLKDFLDKPLIIDMWFAECGACIEAMPFLDSLQKEYKGKMNIVLSTFQPLEKARSIFETTRTLQNIKFTQVVSDSTLLSLFPARTFPHQIWIDKNRTVVAITSGEYTNRQNVEKFINGENIAFKEKVDVLDHEMVNGKEPLMNYLYDRDKDKILIYSYLSRFRPGFATLSNSAAETVKGNTRYTLLNYWFSSLYQAAYRGKPNSSDFNVNTDFIRKDTLSIATAPDFVNYTNIFCYDIIFPNSMKDRISNYMVTELDNIFNLKSHVEKRMISCYIVRPVGDKRGYLEPLFANKMPEFQNRAMKINNKIIINKFFPTVLKDEFTRRADKPFYFEGLEKGLWSLELMWNPKDITTMSKELAKYDLEIVLEDRERSVIVLENR